jgi:hypothetical protein
MHTSAFLILRLNGGVVLTELAPPPFCADEMVRQMLPHIEGGVMHGVQSDGIVASAIVDGTQVWIFIDADKPMDPHTVAQLVSEVIAEENPGNDVQIVELNAAPVH